MDNKHKKVGDALKKALADTYVLYLKTQNYHWNVEGPHFVYFHALFETQYKDLAEAVDGIAELIRSLNEKAPGSFKAFQDLTVIAPAQENTSALTMVEDLLKDHETLLHRLGEALGTAIECKDEVTADFLIVRMTFHRKTAWMLRTTLQ